MKTSGNSRHALEMKPSLRIKRMRVLVFLALSILLLWVGFAEIASQEADASEARNALGVTERGKAAIPVNSQVNLQDGTWIRSVGDELLNYRWVGSNLQLVWDKSCESTSAEITVGPQNWGLSKFQISSSSVIPDKIEREVVPTIESVSVCGTSPRMFTLGDTWKSGPSYWTCFNFSEIWVRKTVAKGEVLLRFKVPEWVHSIGNCPADSHLNKPSDLTVLKSNKASLDKIELMYAHVLEVAPVSPVGMKYQPPRNLEKLFSSPDTGGGVPTLPRQVRVVVPNPGGGSSIEPTAVPSAVPVPDPSAVPVPDPSAVH